MSQHPHVCPVCKLAFMCAGARCGAFNGVPHFRCAPSNRFARMTVEAQKPPAKVYHHRKRPKSS